MDNLCCWGFLPLTGIVDSRRTATSEKSGDRWTGPGGSVCGTEGNASKISLSRILGEGEDDESRGLVQDDERELCTSGTWRPCELFVGDGLGG